MRVISIKNCRKHITAVMLDDGSELLLDNDIVAEKNLRPGGIVTDPDALLYESDFKRAKSRALWYLSRGDLSEKALAEKLKAAGFKEEAVETTVFRMTELGLIDDEKYAAHLCEYLKNTGISRKELYFKLINKGIPSEIAKYAVEEDDIDEAEIVLKLIKGKYQTKMETEEGIKKVFAALVRKGFSYSDIKDAFKAYNEEINCEEDD